MSTEEATPQCSTSSKEIFPTIQADDPDLEPTEIESACMQCFKMGSTRMMLTKIPFYKEIVLMSFKCEHCGFENNEVQSATEIQEKGIRFELSVNSVKDLNRKIVRSDHTSTMIPVVDLQIPCGSQKGEITTVEGIIDRTIRGLLQDQDKRRIENPDVAESIDHYVLRLTNLKERFPFMIIVEDISGNSFVENPNAPSQDHQCKTTYFLRTPEQDKILGIYTKDEIAKNTEENNLLKPISEGAWPIENLHGEVFQFATNCPSCKAPCETNMKLTNIPHFKEVVIMATVCDRCGAKTNEVKSGGGIEDQGVRIEIRVENTEDLSRDVLKSETCELQIPEIDCKVGCAALGGRFTTVEGVFTAMKDQLETEGIHFRDAADSDAEIRFDNFIQKLDDILALKLKVTLILDDPAGNSYVQSLEDAGPDPKLNVKKYDRSFHQNEELGLNDMKTENY